MLKKVSKIGAPLLAQVKVAKHCAMATCALREKIKLETSDHVKNGATPKSHTSRTTKNIIKHGKRKNNFLEKLSFKDITYWSFICPFDFCSFSRI
jgi:hypothetical protein